MRISKLNLDSHASGNDDLAIAMICGDAIADCQHDDHDVVLLKFVRALAKRQGRIDVGLAFDAANDNERRILN
jgi:hypothetical protein